MIRDDAGDRLRWLVLAIFVLSSAINYLDRQALATLAPAVRAEFSLTREQFGWILTAFSITYAAAAPFAGMLIDRAGLNRAATAAVGLWSCAGIATGFTRGLGGLFACRSVLGVAEAAGIPAGGKAIHQYLRPAERGLGNALNQAGVGLGLISPPLIAWLAQRSGWRQAFVVTGTFGLLWIPLWLWASRLAGAAPAPKPDPGDTVRLLGDSRLWVFMLANALNMIGYSLWSNWTSQFLVDVHKLSLMGQASYAWIPVLFATIGGFAGGWASLRLVKRGVRPAGARFRICLLASILALSAAPVPFMPTPAWATAAISASFFAVSAFSVNNYTLPLDTFGGPRAAFAISMLVASYGGVQAVVSPLIGRSIDLHGYMPVTSVAAFTPLAAAALLWFTRATR